METNQLALDKGFAKILRQTKVGKTGYIFMVKMTKPLGEANYLLLLSKKRNREVVKKKMQELRKNRGVSCRNMNNRSVKSWWACWGFLDKQTAARAFLVAEKNLFKASTKVGGKSIALFDQAHQDKAKSFFIERARYHRNFSDNLS
jgi:hypothetical protein